MSNTLNDLQNNLNNDDEVKSSYINSKLSESESDSSDSESEKCKVIIPRRKKHFNANQELLTQVFTLQQTVSKLHKKMYKIKGEIDSEEIKSRYTKLDLNNLQIKKESLLKDIKDLKLAYQQSNTENMLFRFFLCVYMLYRLYTIIF